jgi:hypothetical protein
MLWRAREADPSFVREGENRKTFTLAGLKSGLGRPSPLAILDFSAKQKTIFCKWNAVKNAVYSASNG